MLREISVEEDREGAVRKKKVCVCWVRMEKEIIKRKRMRLYLQFGICVQHDVFAGTLDVLGPAGQPGYRVVMPYLFPAVTSRGHWDTGIAVVQWNHIQ